MVSITDSQQGSNEHQSVNRQQISPNYHTLNYSRHVVNSGPISTLADEISCGWRCLGQRQGSMTTGVVLMVFAWRDSEHANSAISLEMELAPSTKKRDSRRVRQGEKRKRNTHLDVKLLLISRGSTTRRGQARAQSSGNGTRHKEQLSFPRFGLPTQLDLGAGPWCSDQRQDICMLKLERFLSRLIGSNIGPNQPVVPPEYLRMLRLLARHNVS
ncbi:hypothetical protein LZ30DRAFT_336675 [Colletotrichum cereale]|nr:hypothetical protein LZ30DRAFT_336675 [Colletotrichum cereale]